MIADRERAVVNSALWAAAGDALGWITELARDGTVAARAGVERVSEPVPWQRLIGGRFGVKIPLPAGTYSDDTQLRLAVCRAIRGNGVFDAEAFARIELTVWQSYTLGAGSGTKAAAANLTKRGVTWFSNFFDTRAKRYPDAGGNGAAMRIQPHVWATAEGKDSILAVVRDALITHGHPHGFCGAVLHAMALSDALSDQRVPPPSRWYEYLRIFTKLPSIIADDRNLEAFWRPAWEQVAGRSIGNAIEATAAEARRDIEGVCQLVEQSGPSAYESILRKLGCLEDRYRGSGLKTALAACALVWLFREQPVEEALVAAANALWSDTDTIATMAGAMLGAVAAKEPNWLIQDREYIKTEARRLAAISRGETQDNFNYPDLARWQPPTTQSSAVGRTTEGLAVAGLGKAEPQGEEYAAGDSVWQWLRLSFGQTILAKRKVDLRNAIGPEVLPGERRRPQVPDRRGSHETTHGALEPRLALWGTERNPPSSRLPESAMGTLNSNAAAQAQSRLPLDPKGIDKWTDQVIESDFDDRVLGRLLNKCIDERGTIEAAVTFAGIVAKAKLTRRRKAQRR